MIDRQEADEQTLKGIFDLLPPGGHCVFLLPAAARPDAAGRGRADRPPQFDPAEVAAGLSEAGFDVVCQRRFDKLGRLGGGRLSPQLAALADRFWPLAQWADWLLPFSGQTLLIVGRKPGLALQRAAA